tara:strand:- start:505 stop:828 length:324 start_codon:yes stop_codon:yes gene_type:complete
MNLKNCELKKIFAVLFISFSFSNDIDFLSKAASAIKDKKYKEALIYLDIAENDNKKNPDFLRLKALTYEILDKPDQAKKAWKKCHKYSVDTNMKREAKIHIQNLSNN